VGGHSPSLRNALPSILFFAKPVTPPMFPSFSALRTCNLGTLPQLLRFGTYTYIKPINTPLSCFLVPSGILGIPPVILNVCPSFQTSFGFSYVFNILLPLRDRVYYYSVSSPFRRAFFNLSPLRMLSIGLYLAISLL